MTGQGFSPKMSGIIFVPAQAQTERGLFRVLPVPKERVFLDLRKLVSKHIDITLWCHVYFL